MTNKVKELVKRLDDQLEWRWGEIYYNFEGKGFLNVPVELIESCKSELEKLEAENSWQPIETAPKDGTTILLFFPKGDIEIISDWWHSYANGDGHWDNGEAFIDECKPTHWRPFPQPPEGV